MVKTADITKDGQVDFAEFAQYVLEHEKKLMLHFKRMDANEDGKMLFKRPSKLTKLRDRWRLVRVVLCRLSCCMPVRTRKQAMLGVCKDAAEQSWLVVYSVPRYVRTALPPAVSFTCTWVVLKKKTATSCSPE